MYPFGGRVVVVDVLPLLAELWLRTLLLLLLLAFVMNPLEVQWSMDAHLAMPRLMLALSARNLVKPLSELIEWRNGRILPLKKTSSAAHISAAAQEPKSKS